MSRRALPRLTLPRLPVLPRAERFAMLPALLLCALFAARAMRTGTPTFAFLLVNTAIAFLPVPLALLADQLSRRGRWIAAAAALAGWLLFLPNAPYIISDLVHLRERSGVPLWFDIGLFSTAALAGLTFGIVSLARAHRIVARTWGENIAAIAVCVACLASGYGIHLGRFARLNSWDVVLAPWTVAHFALPPLLDPWAHTKAWGVTLVFGAITAVSFWAVRGLSAAHAHSSAAR